MAGRKWQATERVLCTPLPDGSAVLLDLAAEEYFGLNEVGATIWERLADGAYEPDIVEHVISLYDSDRSIVESDVARLLTSLAERGLAVDCSELQ